MRRHWRLIPLLILVLAACDGTADEVEVATTEADTTPTETAAPEATETVVMEDIAFVPDEITVSPGTTVTWTNEDQVAHTSTSEDDVWASGDMEVGDSFSHTFEVPGTYPYICQIHPAQMQGTVVVEG